MYRRISSIAGAIIGLVLAWASASAASSAGFVDLGRSASGTIYYYGDHVLPSPYLIQADTGWTKLYIMDGSGQRYPEVVHKPDTVRVRKPMSAAVAKLMPDALNTDMNAQRDQLGDSAYATGLEAIKNGASDDQAIIVMAETYESRPDLVERVVIQRDRSIVRYWKEWEMPDIIKPDLHPAPEPTKESKLRQDAVDLLTHLRSDFTVAIGWEGQYHVVPKYYLQEFREEIAKLKQGDPYVMPLCKNPNVTDLFRATVPLDQIKQMGKED